MPNNIDIRVSLFRQLQYLLAIVPSKPACSQAYDRVLKEERLWQVSYHISLGSSRVDVAGSYSVIVTPTASSPRFFLQLRSQIV